MFGDVTADIHTRYERGVTFTIHAIALNCASITRAGTGRDRGVNARRVEITTFGLIATTEHRLKKTHYAQYVSREHVINSKSVAD